jgi:hypothetical protein
MSVNPLDLQVNFSQLSQVGKQQSLQKEGEILRQDHASEEINKHGTKDSEDVPETKDLSEGPDTIKDRDRKKKQKQEEDDESGDSTVEASDTASDEKTTDEKGLKKAPKDPGCGQNIDIIG